MKRKASLLLEESSNASSSPNIPSPPPPQQQQAHPHQPQQRCITSYTKISKVAGRALLERKTAEKGINRSSGEDVLVHIHVPTTSVDEDEDDDNDDVDVVDTSSGSSGQRKRRRRQRRRRRRGDARVDEVVGGQLSSRVEISRVRDQEEKEAEEENEEEEEGEVTILDQRHCQPSLNSGSQSPRKTSAGVLHQDISTPSSSSDFSSSPLRSNDHYINIKTRGSSLLERIRTKERHRASLPPAPSKAEMEDHSALERLMEIVPVLNFLVVSNTISSTSSSSSSSASSSSSQQQHPYSQHISRRKSLSPSSSSSSSSSAATTMAAVAAAAAAVGVRRLGTTPRSRCGNGARKFSLSLTTLVQHLQNSLRNPISKEEAHRCIQLLAKDIAPDWIQLMNLGKIPVVILLHPSSPPSANVVLHDRGEGLQEEILPKGSTSGEVAVACYLDILERVKRRIGFVASSSPSPSLYAK